MASYLGRRSTREGSSAIMHIQSLSLPYQWPIHQTFIFCPLSTVSLCLSLPSLGCHERWKNRGGGVVFFSPPTFPSQIVLVNQTSYLRLETLPAPLPFNPILGPQEGWPATLMLNFLMNSSIIKYMIKLWFCLGVFLRQHTSEQRMLQREEMSEIIESSPHSLQKSKGQGCDKNQGLWSFFRQRFPQDPLPVLILNKC